MEIQVGDTVKVWGFGSEGEENSPFFDYVINEMGYRGLLECLNF